MNNIEILSVYKLLGMQLNIPYYQRPYKWGIRNIQDLLTDISNAIEDSKKYDNFKYRIGTVILHINEKNDGGYDIVDGQQRIVSLLLIMKCLEQNYDCSVLNVEFDNKITQLNIHRNFKFIKEWFSLKENAKTDFIKAFYDILEVVIISVKELSEAFQLFDSQNTRGKELDPHDLLKAYHLREMKEYPYEMEHAVTKWEAKDTAEIHELFDLYLFPIWHWSRGSKSKPFTAKEIDTYKGISGSSKYTYAKRASKAMPYFQITEPFIAGNDFFDMVDHYLLLLHNIKTEIQNNEAFAAIKNILSDRNGTGFCYAKNLFYCVLFCYYDKFHNFDEMSVKKLFVWAFMIRVDMENLGFDSINKYAIGDETSKYTNTIAMFSKINLARLHNEISNLQIKIRETAKSHNWETLLAKIIKIAGESNE